MKLLWIYVLLVCPVCLIGQKPELVVPIGHTSFVNDVAFSPNGKYVLTGSHDHTAKLWDLQGTEIQTFKGHRGSVNSVAFSPDGSCVLTGSSDNTAMLWDLEGNEIQRFVGHSWVVVTVAFSPDGKYVLTGGVRKARLWDLKGNQILSFSDLVNSVAFSPDGSRVLIGSGDHTAQLWDLQGNEPQTFIGHTEGVNSIAFSPDGHRVLTGSKDGTAILWDLDGNELQTFKGHSSSVETVSFSPDGNHLLTGSDDETVKLWDLKGNWLQTFEGHTYRVTSVAFSPDGRQILTGSWDHTAKLWDLQGNKLQDYNEHSNSVFAVAFSPDGKRVLTGSGNLEPSEAKMWDLQTNQLQTFVGHAENVSSVAFSPEGRLVLTGSGDRSARLWDLQGNEVEIFEGHTDLVLSVTFSPNGRQVLTGSADGSAKLWNLDGSELQTFRGISRENHFFYSVIFSPDGKLVLAGSSDHTAKLWNLQGKKLYTFTGHDGSVNSVAFSPDGSLILTGSSDHTGKLWDLQGNQLASLIAIDSNDWIVTTPSGLFDASPGAMDHMHYVIGLEVIELEQLKERYYEPGLLQKLLGFEEGGVRDVSVFDNVALYPEVNASIDKHSLNIHLTERSGGIGKISLFVNQKEQIEDANPDRRTSLSIDLRQFTDFYQEEENSISLRAYNEEGWLKSSEIALSYEPESKVLGGIPSLYTICIGTSEYNGDYLDLSFAGKDAVAISDAFGAAGEELFQDRVLSYLLSTESGEEAPSKTNIQQTFQSIADQAKPQDIVLVYLSGHGVTYGETEKGNFYYLTKDVASEDLSDTEIRRNYAISDDELTRWMNEIPALKQVMIIDACNSGKVVENLLASAKKLNSTQIRALDRMKDRTGMYVLAGSAADKVSYEASQYGQGLLTHSILSGMSGRAITEDGRIDVMNLFQFSRDEVPRLAESINGIQTPMMAFPYGGESFDIGIMREGTSIPVAESKPVFVRSALQDEDAFDDVLDLSDLIDQYLEELTDKGSIVFVPVKRYTDSSFSLKGRYRSSGNTIMLNARLFRGKEQVAPIQVDGKKEDIEALLKAIMREIGKHL